MHWLFLLLSLGALFLAFRTTSMALMLASLLVAFGLIVAWAIAWYQSRVGGNDRPKQLIDPAELRRLREVAEARRSANSGDTDSTPPAP
ncbi:MAG: hypothetical protein ABW178_02695 [Pseudoxanthomonas sp.]